MEEQKLVVLNTDQKEVVQRRAKDAFFALKQLADWVEGDQLSEEMRETLPNLIHMHLSDVKKAIGHTGEESDREKEMTRAITKNMQDRIKELEKMVENQTSILSVKQQLKAIGDKLNVWWDEKGFNYIKDIGFSSGGNIIITFGFMLESMSLRYSDTPDSDQRAALKKIQDFKDQGYVFIKNKDENDKELVDCEKNRELLIELITSTFPSAIITKWENHRYVYKCPDQGKFYLRSFEVIIYDYSDIEEFFKVTEQV